MHDFSKSGRNRHIQRLVAYLKNNTTDNGRINFGGDVELFFRADEALGCGFL